MLGGLALAAFGAAGASAHEFESTLAGKGVIVKNNAQTFTAGGSTVTCSGVSTDRSSLNRKSAS